MNHIGQHMGVDRKGKFDRVMNVLIKEKRLPYKGTPKEQTAFALTYDWSSGFLTSGYTTVTAAKSQLKKKLTNLTPGYHVCVAHPAMDHASLDALCSADFHARNWARVFRAIDLELLLDKEILEIIQANGIEITPLAECPIRAEEV